MKCIAPLTVASALYVLVGCATGSSATSGQRDSSGDEAAIRKLDQDWTNAIAAKDLDRILTFYASDAQFMPPNKPPSVGAEPIRKSWSDMLGLPGVSLTFEPSVVRVSSDGQMAYDVGTYSFAFDGPNGRRQDEGKYAQVWQKRDGNWKVVIDMFSSNLPVRPPQ